MESRDSVDNTVEENSSVFSLIRMRWLLSCKTLHQQNPPVLNWRCRLMQVGGCCWWWWCINSEFHQLACSASEVTTLWRYTNVFIIIIYYYYYYYY